MANFIPRLLAALWEEIYYPEKTLGLSRDQMPQIRSFLVPEFLAFLQKRGITHRNEVVNAADLKPVQKEINAEKARTYNPGLTGNKVMLVSHDGYIMDGHHRWLNAVWNKQRLPVVRLSADIRTLLGLAKAFPQTEYRDVNHSYQTAA